MQSSVFVRVAAATALLGLLLWVVSLECRVVEGPDLGLRGSAAQEVVVRVGLSQARTSCELPRVQLEGGAAEGYDPQLVVGFEVSVELCVPYDGVFVGQLRPMCPIPPHQKQIGFPSTSRSECAPPRACAWGFGGERGRC